MPRLSTALLALVIGVAPVAAQEMTANERGQVIDLLSYQCGVDMEIGARFRAGIANYGDRSKPLLLEVLSDGLPDDVRAATAERAAERYERRQAWLAENGTKIFGDQTVTLETPSQEDYVADALAQLELLYRENAVRGLGVVGGDDAKAAVEAAMEDDASLEIIGNEALKAIDQP